MVLTLPVASFDPEDYARAEPSVQGLVNLVEWEVWRWSDNGEISRQQSPKNVQEPENTGISDRTSYPPAPGLSPDDFPRQPIHVLRALDGNPPQPPL